MASLDDYDEFGNYIGADLDSDDEDDDQQKQYSYPGPSQPQAQPSRPLEGFHDEDEQMHDEPAQGALMEIDGMLFPSPPSTFDHPFQSKNPFPDALPTCFILLKVARLLKSLVCNHRTRSQRRNPPRRQTVLPICIRRLWPGCRDFSPGGGHPTPHRAHHRSNKIQEMVCRRKRYARNKIR